MRNTLTNRQQEYEVPVRQGGEFRHFLSHLRHMFELPEEFEPGVLEPKIEFSETKDAVNVVAEVPGIDEKDLDVEISADGYLSISGEKKSSIEHNKGDRYFSEVSYGMFQRTVPLPWDLDYAKAEGDYEDGVLKIRIPKTAVEQSKKKKLPIKNRKKQQ